jgi:hypothetical protein
MVIALVLGNHWQGDIVWPEEDEEVETSMIPFTEEDKLDSLNAFFDDLFNSIDYSLLLIFIGIYLYIDLLNNLMYLFIY